MKPSWQLTTPLDAIIFDCDGTLSAIEGIDELATQNGVGQEVATLTAEAMSKSGLTPQIYGQRLALTRPTLQQVLAIGDLYHHHRSPDLDSVLLILRTCNKPIYIISSGIMQAVATFAEQLYIPREQVYAVPLVFNNEGEYSHFDETHLLVGDQGKTKTIAKYLTPHYQNMVLIGDGITDYQASSVLTRFIGYGGAYYREKLAAISPFYVTISSLIPLLPLCLTPDEIAQLKPDAQFIVNLGIDAIEQGLVRLNK